MSSLPLLTWCLYHIVHLVRQTETAVDSKNNSLYNFEIVLIGLTRLFIGWAIAKQKIQVKMLTNVLGWILQLCLMTNHKPDQASCINLATMLRSQLV